MTKTRRAITTVAVRERVWLAGSVATSFTVERVAGHKATIAHRKLSMARPQATAAHSEATHPPQRDIEHEGQSMDDFYSLVAIEDDGKDRSY